MCKINGGGLSSSCMHLVSFVAVFCCSPFRSFISLLLNMLFEWFVAIRSLYTPQRPDRVLVSHLLLQRRLLVTPLASSTQPLPDKSKNDVFCSPVRSLGYLVHLLCLFTMGGFWFFFKDAIGVWCLSIWSFLLLHF